VEPAVEEPVVEVVEITEVTVTEAVVDGAAVVEVTEVVAEVAEVPAPEPPARPDPDSDPTPPTTAESVEAAGEEDAAADAVAPMPFPRIVAIANQKGGVGKTTTAVNLGAAIAESGLRVLVVDLDPQGNASTGLGINPRDVAASIYDVLMHDTPAMDAVEPTSLKNLFVIPATIDLAGAEIELVPAFSRELKLRRALEPLRQEYDLVLIDCPPSLGLLTVNGLAAADDVIVPIQCEYYALEGLGQLLRNVALVRSSLNADLDVRGIILTMYDGRTSLARQVESEVREHFGNKVYRTVVPRTVRLSEAPSFGQPIIVFDSTSRGATAYRELAKEVSGGATRRTG
jgi:chromosome partitioning protein